MDKHRIRICSDPYREHIYYYWQDESGKWENMEEMDESPLNKERFVEKPLSHSAYDVLKTIQEKLYNKTVGMEIIFEGTDDDYAYFESVREAYFSDYKITVSRGPRKVRPAKVVMPQIEESFARLNEYFGKYPDPETEAILAQYKDAVKPEIAICVMGLYSSGKSAFINSLLGQEVLSSASDPATAKIYKIREPEVPGNWEVSFGYQGKRYSVKFEGGKWKWNLNLNSEIIRLIKSMLEEKQPKTPDQSLYWTLSALNDYARDEGRRRHDELVKCAKKMLGGEGQKLSKGTGEELDEDELIARLLRLNRIKDLVKKGKLTANKLDDVIEVRVDFVHSALPREQFDFIIYDTPGSNSVQFREHADILKDSLEQQTNGLPIFVTNPDTMDETDNKEIMEIINELGGALDVSNMLIVVNKADEKSKSTLQQKADKKDELAVTRWKNSKVCFVSSIVGLGGKKSNPEREERWIDADYYSIFLEKMDKFSNPDSKLYVRLFDYNILPKDSKEQLEKRTRNLGTDELLLWNSGIPCVEGEIDAFARKHALYNKCAQAIRYLEEAAEKLEKNIEDARKNAEDLQKEIEVRLDEKMKRLMEELKAKSAEKKSQYIAGFTNLVIKDTGKKFLDRERIAGIVNEVYKGCAGKKEIEKLQPFNVRLDAALRKDVSEYAHEASKRAESYYRKCEEDLKAALMRIVAESPNLTVGQREQLKAGVLKYITFPEEHRVFNVSDTDAVANKGKRFFFFFDRTRIDLPKVAEKYQDALSGDFGLNSGKAIEANEAILKNWVQDLLNRLSAEVSSFNPVLITLKEDMEKQGNVIKEKGREIQSIIAEMEKVEELMEFEEVQG